jgi:hypothetical protein
MAGSGHGRSGVDNACMRLLATRANRCESLPRGNQSAA